MSSRAVARAMPARDPRDDAELPREGKGGAPAGKATGQVVVVFNPAGGDADKLDEAREAFRERGVDPDWVETTEDDPGAGMAATAARDGAALVIAAGGDGTVRSCTQGLLGSDVPLAVIPTGTGNLLARGLDIPLDIAEAVEVALTGRPRSVDVGLANGEPFVVMAGMGLDARMVEDADPALKKRLGPLAYVITALRHIRRPPFSVELDIQGEGSLSCRATMVLAGNFGELPGGISPFEDADPTDGRLEVLVVETRGVLGWLRAMTAALLRGADGPIRRFSTAKLVINADRAELFELDGDERPATRKLEFAVEPGALRCIVPAGGDEEP